MIVAFQPPMVGWPRCTSVGRDRADAAVAPARAPGVAGRGSSPDALRNARRGQEERWEGERDGRWTSEGVASTDQHRFHGRKECFRAGLRRMPGRSASYLRRRHRGTSNLLTSRALRCATDRGPRPQAAQPRARPPPSLPTRRSPRGLPGSRPHSTGRTRRSRSSCRLGP